MVDISNSTSYCQELQGVEDRRWTFLAFIFGVPSEDQDDINVFWMGHERETISELFEEVEERLTPLTEVQRVGVGFDVPAYVAPSCSKN